MVEPHVELMPKETQRQRISYDCNRTFQNVWTSKLPLAQVVIGLNGKIHQVRFMVCTRIERKEKLLAPKMDCLWNHAGCRKTRADIVGVVYKMGEYYVSKECTHV